MLKVSRSNTCGLMDVGCVQRKALRELSKYTDPNNESEGHILVVIITFLLMGTDMQEAGPNQDGRSTLHA